MHVINKLIYSRFTSKTASYDVASTIHVIIELFNPRCTS